MCMCQLRLTLEKSIPWKQYIPFMSTTPGMHMHKGVLMMHSLTVTHHAKQVVI